MNGPGPTTAPTTPTTSPVAESWWQASWMPELIHTGLLVIVAAIAFVLTRRVLLPLLSRVISRTKTTTDDVLLDRRVLHRASWLVAGAALVVYDSLVLEGLVLDGALAPGLSMLADNVGFALLIVAGMITVGALLDAGHQLYSRSEMAATRPIKGYLQIVKLLLYLGGAIVAVSVLADKDPTVFLTGLGAMTAVLLLVFKDTILSLVASVQLTSNDMLRVGDWLEMPSVGADGDVIDIALHTVKVQNWDKTISTIPTHLLISSSFKNWRGMQESGGRRIKRAIYLDVGTIRFLTEEQLAHLARSELLADYLASKQAEIAADADQGDTSHDNESRDTVVQNEEAQNDESHHDDGSTIHRIPNARRLTNIGTFRAWLVAYLRSREDIHRSGMTFLVRQLQGGPQGVPIELYCSTTTIVWADYEGIQSDIFDHCYAMLPEFGLRAFQEPSGGDLQGLRQIHEGHRV